MEVTKAIEHLYRVFEPYSFKPLIGCPHCTTPEDSDRVARPLHELSGKDLERFAFKSMTTLGDRDDFRHLLPRILELVVLEGTVGENDVEVAIGKLDYGHWLSWNKSERDAVTEFLHAWWEHVLSNYPGVLTADSAICSIGRVASDLSEYLEHWGQTRSASSLEHLTDFIVDNFEGLIYPKKRRPPTLRNPFWEERAVQMNQVIIWVARPETAELLQAGTALASSAESLEKLITAHACIEAIHAAI